MKPQTAEWVEKAEGDWRVARREWASAEPVYDAVCFHAQQTVEKYLKALLEEEGITLPKTHDLVVLSELLPGTLGAKGKERGPLAILSAYSVAFRYPGDTAVREDAEQSLETAGRIRAWAREKLRLPGS